MQNPDDNSDWQELLSSGEKHAFNVVYTKLFAEVYHYAKKIVRNTHVAEDITTESFVKLWEIFSRISGVNAARAFLFTATRNACLNAIRSEIRASNRERIFSDQLEDMEDNADITGKVFQFIFNEVEKLPPQEKNVFKLSYLEGKTNEEIAALLDINNQSVRNYKARALKTLRNVCKESNVYSFLLLFTQFQSFVEIPL